MFALSHSRHLARQQWGLILVTAVSVLAYGKLVWLHWQYGTLRDTHIPQTITWYLVAFAAFISALIWAEKRPASLKWLWGAAILFRALLLFTTPTLSDDVYRYLWDGYVATKGVSPYAFAIDAPEMDYLDIPQRALANNREMASPYLPVAQWVFGGAAFFFPLQPIVLQILMVLFDLLAALLIAKLLALAGLPAQRLLLYLWNPLVVVEVAHGAHLDAWMMLLTVMAVWFSLAPHHANTIKGKVAAPLFLALATLTKILPILLLPVLLWRWSWRQLMFYGLIVIGLLIPSGWRAGWGLAGALDGTGLFGALRIYGKFWNFNSGLFHWLEGSLAKNDLPDPNGTAKLINLIVMLMVLFTVWALAWRPEAKMILRLTAVPFIAYLLLTPTVHPWYSLILLVFTPFLAPGALEPRWLWWAVVPWIYLSGVLVFSYITYINPLDFREFEWVRQLEWLPTLLFLFISLIMIMWLTRRSFSESSQARITNSFHH